MGNVQNADDLVHSVEFVGQPHISTSSNINAMQLAITALNVSAVDRATRPCVVGNDPAMCDCGTHPVYGPESTLDVQQMVAAAQGGWVYAYRSGYWTHDWHAATDYADTLYTILDVVWAALYGDVHPQTLSFSYGMPMGGCAASVLERPFGDVLAEQAMVNKYVNV